MAPPTKIVFHLVKRQCGDALKDFVVTVKVLDSPFNYKFPEEFQALEHHVELSAQPIVKKASKTMSKAGQYRNVKISLTENLLTTYWDKDENFVFRDCVLEEVPEDSEIQRPEETRPQRTAVTQTSPENRTLSILAKIEKNFAVNKFDRATQKAIDWIDDFEKECARFEITTSEMKVRALRYFVQDASQDWYKTCLTQLPIEDFEAWKKSFLTVFGERGWSRMEYAFGFKYLAGSYSDYAIKKLRLLLDVEREMTVETRINLVVFGLPSELRGRIDKKDITDIDSLMNELTLFGSAVKQQTPSWRNRSDKYAKKSETPTDQPIPPRSSNEKRPCAVCEALNFPNRFHPSDKCWNKGKKIPGARINLNEEVSDDASIDPTSSKN